VAARRLRRAMFGVVCALFFVVLTLGPVVPGTNIPLPFGILRHFGLSMFRAPYRIQIPAALAMTLALAAVLGHLLARAPRARVRMAILGVAGLLILADAVAHRAAYGFETHPVPFEPIYQAIAATPGDFLLLEIPVGVRSGSDAMSRLRLTRTTRPMPDRTRSSSIVAASSTL